MHKIIAAVVVLIILLWSVVNLISGVQTIDRDGDGLSDTQEREIGTSWQKQDSDNDGVNDYNEYNFWNELSKKYDNESFLPSGDVDGDGKPNILDDDSDGDGISDGDEVKYWNKRYADEGIENLKPDGDIDNDGIPNILDDDSDNDRALDGFEIDPDGLQTDPADPHSPSDLIYGGTSGSPTMEPSRDGYHTDPTCIAVFDPYLSGKKRFEICDAIDEEYTAYVYNKQKFPIELSSEKYENVFTGNINLQLSRNYIRIPSVAPNARIHTYDTSTNTYLEFFKDGADNYYVS